MEKIDLKDKYIHSPNWECRSDLSRFRKILKSGRLLTPISSGTPTCYRKDLIFFAVHPKGLFAADYPAGKYACFSNTDGYDMASSGVFFILNSKLREEYDLQPVTYKYECATTSNVDLFKYLEGIGNVGFYVSEKLIYSYYFIKYANGEVPASRVLEIVEDRNPTRTIEGALEIEGRYVSSRVAPEYNYLNYVFANDADSLIRPGPYYEIVKILEEENKKFRLYDQYGYAVDPEARVKEVHAMYEYLEKNRGFQTGDSYFEKINELCEAAQKKIS